ncbi:MAG: SBBP repeat-containing protein [Bacteroidota bacterium]
MKKALLFITTILAISVYGQQPTFEWAKSMGGIDENTGESIAVDLSGNVYTIGRFEGTTDFDPGPGVFNLTSEGALDVFISKLDASGNFVWAKQLSGSNSVYGYSIDVDLNGNVYTTGYINGTVDFDPGAGTFNLTSTGPTDAFISKLDASGNFVWAKNLGGTGDNIGRSIAVDASGNVYTTGQFTGTTDFDPGIGTTNLNSAGSHDVFISKLDVNGNFVWAKQFGGTNSDRGQSIFLDDNGNIYTSGAFSSTSDFDPGVGTYNLTSVSAIDVFVSKLDAAGDFVWAKKLAGTNSSIVVDTSGNVFTTGYYSGTADFDPGTGTYNLTSEGSYDIFISKLNSSGNFEWAKSMGGPNYDRGVSIALDSSSNVYTIGGFQGTVDFDPGAGTYNLTSGGFYDIFISKLNTSGNFVWAVQLGGTNYDHGFSIAIDSSKYVYTTGYFQETVDFNPGSGTYNLTSDGGSDTYIHKLKLCELPTQPSTISGNTNLCNGDTETYSVTNDPNVDTYNWTLPSGWSGTSTSNSINVTAGSTGGTIEVTATNACGTSTVQTLTVNVDDIPAQPSAITGNTDLCNGDVETYSVTNDPNADTYNWTLPSGWSGTSTTNSISVTAGSTGGTIEVTAENACGTSTVENLTVNVNDVPAQPSTITGNTNLCAGDVETFSVTNDPNADTYNWTLPSGWSGTSTSNSINATSGSTGGTIEVTAENACGASSPQTIAITVDDVPAQPGTISGDDVVCEGSEQNYGITSVSGATDYTWSLPGGWSGTSTTNMITTTVSALGGTLTVTANNACGSSTPETLSITVNELPTVTYNQNPAFACVYHDAFTLGSVSPSGGTFSGTGVSGDDFDPTTADIGTHDITYTYTDGNGCTNEVTQQIEVDGCVGLEDQESQSMTVYPNPFDEAFTIEFNKSGNHTVKLLNSLGQIITTIRTEEQSTQISTTDLSPGVYYIRVVEDNSSFKVIKK